MVDAICSNRLVTLPGVNIKMQVLVSLLKIAKSPHHFDFGFKDEVSLQTLP